MKEKLKELITQHLVECDEIRRLIRQLHVDKLEFYVYEELQFGAFFPAEMKNIHEDIFFRARNSMQNHLEQLEHTYRRSQEIFQEIISITQAVVDG